MHDEQAIALEYLSDLAFGILLFRPGPERATELARLLPEGVELSAEFVNQALTADGRFRSALGSHDIGCRAQLSALPVGGAVKAILAAYGKPMPPPLLAGELRHSEKAGSVTFDVVLSSLEGSGIIGMIGHSHVYLTDWIFRPMPGMEPARALYLNELDADEALQAVWDTCTNSKLGSRSLTDTAAAVLEAARRPLSNKALGALVAQHHGEKFDPVELLRQMLADEQGRFASLSGPRWMLASWLPKLSKTLSGLSEGGRPDALDADIAEMLTREVEEDKRRTLTAEEVQAITQLVQAWHGTVTVEQVVADVLELTPNQRKYAPAVHAVEVLLSTMQSLRRLHPGRYLRSAAVPWWARVVPETLIVPRWTIELGEGGKLRSRDVLLALEGLSESAREAATEPYYDDIGEPYVSPVVAEAPADRITYPVLYHHYRAGTMYVRATDMEFYASDANLIPIDLRYKGHLLIGAWLNRETRLVTGLGPWFQTVLPPSGAELTIVKTDTPGEYLLEYDGETDSKTYIGRETLAELEEWSDRLHGHPLSLRELCLPLIGDKGIPFDQLWAQLSFIRRVSRAKLASILTFYDCFSYGDGARWYVDPGKGAAYDEGLLEHVAGLQEALTHARHGRK